MSKPFVYYWSHLKKYEECPQQFLWYKGWKGIDLGHGVGKPIPRPDKDSRHHAIMGDVIQSAVEQFYNLKWWKEGPTFKDRMLRYTREKLDYDLQNNYIDWSKAPTKEEMLEVCLSGVRGFFKTLKAHKLIGPYARSEVDLKTWLNKWTPVGGRVDILIKRQDQGIMILDGKNSKYRDKYTDPDQLLWYGLCFWRGHHKLPDKLGFMYWRFPHGFVNKETGTVEEGVEWLDFTKEDLLKFEKRALRVRKDMEDHKFDATPGRSVCRFCDHRDLCDEWKEYQQKNKRPEDPQIAKLLNESDSPFVELGFTHDGED